MSQSLHRFVAAGRAAQHCPELLRDRSSRVDLAASWQALGDALARALPARLAPLVSGAATSISASAGPARPGGLCSHTLISCAGAAEGLHLAVEGAAMLRLVDLAFGGRGLVPSPLPATMPPSADMLVRQAEEAVVGALAEALGRPQEDLTVTQRESGDGQPRFAPAAPLTLVLRIEEPAAPDWTLTLAASPDSMAGWLAAKPASAAPGAANPAAAPFADMPLPLAATLVEMRLPLSTVARLEPGMVLPVAVARAVPLTVAGTTIARGSVGAQDDRVALKLTQIA